MLVSQGMGPDWHTSPLWYLGMPLLFIHIPPRTSAEAHLPAVVPSPLPVVAFQCKWLDEWLQLAHQKAGPAEGPW